MPDARLTRTRESLPAGYQFRDAGRPPVLMCACADFLTCEHPWPQLFTIALVLPWRRQSDTAAEQLVRRGWNVIEAETFDSDADHHRVIAGAQS